MKGRQADTDLHAASKGLVVFSIVRDSKCAECGEELWKGSFLCMEGGRPLCLRCADLDHLVCLARGDAALTRRARKHSALAAVVVRFSRARGRYERQGILVEESALQKAEQECLADADQRAARREREEVRGTEQDHDLAAQSARNAFNSSKRNATYGKTAGVIRSCFARRGYTDVRLGLMLSSPNFSVIRSARWFCRARQHSGLRNQTVAST